MSFSATNASIETPTASERGPYWWGTRDRLFPLCALVALGFAIAPIWSSRFLPLLDEPNHLSALYIWRELADRYSPLHAFYKAEFRPVSYLLHYGIAYLFSYVFDVEVAHKLTLCLWVLAFPLAGWLWCRATGRSVWLALTTLPLAYSACWAYGYHPFNAGLAACLLGVVAQDALLARPTVWRWCAGALAALAAYFGHPVALALLWLCTAALWDIRRPRWRAIALSVLTLLPSAALYRWQSEAAHLPPGSLRMALGPTFPVLDAATYKVRLLDFAVHVFNPLPGTREKGWFDVYLGLIALLALASLRRKASYRGLALAAVLFVAYLVLPEHLEEPIYLWVARGRVAPLIAFFLLLTPAIDERSLWRWGALPCVGIFMYLAVVHTRVYREFGREMHHMERALAECPANAQVLTLRMGGADVPPPQFSVPVYRQLASWVQIVHGGFSPELFPRPLPFPFSVQRFLPAPHWRAHEAYAPLLNANLYGCVLTMNLAQLGDDTHYKLERRDGPFALYRARPAQLPSGAAPSSAR